MKKFEGMLFCTDLDGTLYSDDKTVSRENLDAIEYFKSEGGLFTFITGRVPMTSVEIYDTIKPNAPFGCFNGGAIYDPIGERYLWNTFLPREAMELVEVVDRRLPEIGFQLNTERQIYFCKDSDAMVYFREVTGVPNVSARYNEVQEQVIKVVFGHNDPRQIQALMALLNDHPKARRFDFIHSESRLYEILPKGVSKGIALCKLAELLDVDMGKTIAVGDYYNDLSMIRSAGLGFAVANAVDDAKAVADHVSVSNNDHAIADVIDGLDRGIYDLTV